MEKVKFRKVEEPLLKWIGGKRKLLDNILPKFPKKIRHYHEMFTGGGSVLFRFLWLVKNKQIDVKKIYAYDSNEMLIAFYKQVKDDYNELYETIMKIKTAGEKCDKSEYYYYIRQSYNSSKEINIGRIAEFVYLNKTGFRGLYRLNKKGEFNVPYGNYKNPEIINLEHLKNISKKIQNVEFICCDFEDIKNIRKNDFVYMDPPYVPEKKGGFVSYNKNGFTQEKHEALFKKCSKLKCKWVLSNSNTDVVKEKLKNYTIEEIVARRAINSKNPNAKTKELIIYN